MISDLKSKLPLKKKAKAEEDEDLEISEESTDAGDKTDPSMNLDKTGATEINEADEDISDDLDDKPLSLIDKIKAKLIPKKKTAAEDADEGTEVDGKKPKKKLSPVAIIVIVLALVFVLMDSEEEKPAVPAVATPRKSLKQPKKEEPAAETPAEAPTETTAEAPVESPAETPAEAPAETTAEAPVETPAEAPAETTVEAPVEAPIESPIETPTETTVEAPVETPAETTTQAPVEATPSEDTVDGTVTAPSDNESMTDKILEDLEKQVKKDQPKEEKKEYVAPPDYEYRGRGMVYNCAGKHWACVDGPSYKTCEDNYSSSKFLKKPIECYPFNVYDNQKGCEAMQNRLVSSNAKTDFCKGN